jgi:hypothetical protein
MRHRSRAAAAFLLMTATMLQGCTRADRPEPPLRVRWADEAATVTVAPLSVTRWEDVVQDLQPQFKMDSDRALQEAIPLTQIMDERFSDIWAMSGRASLPLTTGERVTTIETDADGVETRTVEDTRTRRTGQIPDAPAQLTGPAAAVAALTAATPMQQDPMLRYLAATALQQEVALLNRYVRDAVRWPGSQAFVVRMQVSVMPNGRNLPYDVETDITLHAEDVQALARLGNRVQLPRDATQRSCGWGTGDSLFVVPMVVTDNLESLQAARSEDRTRQIALALMATIGNVGAGGDFRRTLQALRRMEGRDTNSLFTIGKLSDDTVRVRLGAVQSPRYGHVTVPRTHNISLVVVYRPCFDEREQSYVADGHRTMTAVTRTTFRDARSGQALPYVDATARLQSQVRQIASKYAGDFNYLELARLYQWASRQERDRFFQYVIAKHSTTANCSRRFLRELAGARRAYALPRLEYDLLTEPGDYPPYPGIVYDRRGGTEIVDGECMTLARIRYQTIAAPLWTELQSVRPAGEFAYTTIPLTLRASAPRLPVAQTALVPVGSSEATVLLPQAGDLSGVTGLRATLVKGALRIPALETRSDDGRSVRMRFAPLERFGIKSSDTGYEIELGAPRRALAGDACPAAHGAAAECVQRYAVRFHSAGGAAAPAGFELSIPAHAVIADAQGRGQIALFTSGAGAAGPLTLRVEGGEIGSVTAAGGAASQSGGTWRLRGAGQYDLSLRNLVPHSVVRIALHPAEGAAVTQTKTVVPQARAAN